jgi:hypothetical protein
MKKSNKKQEEKKLQKLKHAGGRPTIYNLKLAQQICDAVAKSPFGIKKICSLNDSFPHHDTIGEWRLKYQEFSGLYAQAKLKQADILAEFCIEIADDSSQDIIVNKFGEEVCNVEFIARSRLRIDTRKWLASKLLPKLYGDKYILGQKTEENEELKDEIRELRAKLDAKNKKDY